MIFEIVYVIAKRLWIARQRFKVSVLYEFLFKKVVDGAYAQGLIISVVLENLDDLRAEWLFIEHFRLLEFFSRVVREDIHAVILAYGRH